MNNKWSRRLQEANYSLGTEIRQWSFILDDSLIHNWLTNPADSTAFRLFVNGGNQEDYEWQIMNSNDKSTIKTNAVLMLCPIREKIQNISRHRLPISKNCLQISKEGNPIGKKLHQSVDLPKLSNALFFAQKLD